MMMCFAGFAASNDCESLLNLSCWIKTKLPCYLPERPSENQHFLLFLLSASHLSCQQLERAVTLEKEKKDAVVPLSVRKGLRLLFHWMKQR